MDASAEECQTATQHKGTLLPIVKAAPTLEKVAITADMKVNQQCKREQGREHRRRDHRRREHTRQHRRERQVCAIAHS
jgi:hypothetical protein